MRVAEKCVILDLIFKYWVYYSAIVHFSGYRRVRCAVPDTVFFLTQREREKTKPSLNKPDEKMNNFLKKTWVISLAIASACVITFWIAGVQGHSGAAAGSLLCGGALAWVALIAMGLLKLRERNGAFD